MFGLVHLQLERKDMVEEARTRARECALPEPDELERASKELEEFDAQLSRVAWSKGKFPRFRHFCPMVIQNINVSSSISLFRRF